MCNNNNNCRIKLYLKFLKKSIYKCPNTKLFFFKLILLIYVKKVDWTLAFFLSPFLNKKKKGDAYDILKYLYGCI